MWKTLQHFCPWCQNKDVKPQCLTFDLVASATPSGNGAKPHLTGLNWYPGGLGTQCDVHVCGGQRSHLTFCAMD